MPVYRGKLPQEMLQAQNMQNTIENNKPRYIFKKLVELGRIEQLGKMQIVSQVIDLNPPDDSPLFEDQPIPSMLHFFDKVNLASYSLEKIFSRFDDENDAYFDQERFAPFLTEASQYGTTADVIQAAKNIFR